MGAESWIDDPREAWVEVAADLWRSANTGGEEGARHLRTLWKTPDELAGDLRDICDPARELLPAAAASGLAAWLPALRDDARPRFTADLPRRLQRSQAVQKSGGEGKSGAVQVAVG